MELLDVCAVFKKLLSLLSCGSQAGVIKWGEPFAFTTVEASIFSIQRCGILLDFQKEAHCEGCEWATNKEWFVGDVTLRQIFVETHRVPVEADDFFENIQQEGYVDMLHITRNRMSNIREATNSVSNGDYWRWMQLSLNRSVFRAIVIPWYPFLLENILCV